MTSALEAHKRLQKLLPVREHRIQDDKPDRHKAHRRPVEVRGKSYGSVKEAARGERCSAALICKMVKDGRAKYQ
jgi:hypothetical protein